MTTYLQYGFNGGLRNSNDGGSAASSSFWEQHQVAIVFIAVVCCLTAVFGLLLLLCKCLERSRSTSEGSTGSGGGKIWKREVVRLVVSPVDEEQIVESPENAQRQSHVTLAAVLRKWNEKLSGIVSSGRRGMTRDLQQQQPGTKEQELSVFSISVQP